MTVVIDKTWKTLDLCLMVFGLQMRTKNRLKSCCLFIHFVQKGIFFVWIAVSFLYIVLKVITSTRNYLSKSFIHCVDLSCVLIMSVILNQKLPCLYKIRKRIKLVKDQVGFAPKCNKYRFTLLLFCIVHFIHFFITSAHNASSKSNHFKHLDLLTLGRYSYGVLPQHLKGVLMTASKLITMISSAFFEFIPAISSAVCCLPQIECNRLMGAYNQLVTAKLRAKVSPKDLFEIAGWCSKMSKLVRDIHGVLSSLVVVLLGFWMLIMCYSLSIVVKLHRQQLLRFLSYTLSLMMHMNELVTFVNISSDIPGQVSLVRKQLLEMMESDPLVYVDASKSSGFTFLSAAFERYEEETQFTPWEIYHVDRRIIPAFLGLIISYEIILLQFNNN